MTDECTQSLVLLKFQRSVYAIGAVLCFLVITMGAVIWKKFWWPFALGLALGLTSFYVLMVSMKNITLVSGKANLAKGVLLSTCKITVLFLIILLLYYFEVDLLQVIGGIFASQLAVVGGSAFVLSSARGSPT